MMRGAVGGWLWPGLPAHVPDATLVMAERDLARLRAHLLQADRLERAAFGLLGRCRSVEPEEYYLHRLLLPGDGDYRRQDGASVEPAPTYVLHTLHRLATSGAAGYLHAHSHPFSQKAAFSGTDDRFLPGEIATVRGYPRGTDMRRDVPFVRLVWGQREEGFSAEVYRGDGRIAARVRELRAVGPTGIRRIASFATAARAPRVDNGALPVARLDRNIRWLGEDGQQRLREPRLAVCGAGGIGSAWVAQARGLGFHRLILIDPDRVEPSNLNRLFGARLRDVGRLKVKVLAREVRALDPGAEIEIVPAPLQSGEVRRTLLRADLIVCGLDNVAARLEAQVVAARYLKPLLDMGSGIVLRPGTRQVQHMGAQAALYAPGGPCLLCQGVVNPSRILSPEHRALRRGLGYLEGADEAAPPSVVTLNALVAALGLETLVRYLTGFGPASTHVRYDSLAGRLDAMPFARRPDCPVCGDEGIEGLGDDEAERLEPPALRSEAQPAAPVGG